MWYSGGGCIEFQRCLDAKLVVLQELYITRDEKRKSDEDKTKAEQKLQLAQEANQKMEEEMKKAEEKI